MKADGAELRLSKSSMDLYLSCHHAYYLGAVRRIKGAPTLAMAVGRAVHAGIEAHWKGEDVYVGFSAEMTDALASIPTLGLIEVAQANMDGLGLLRTYIAKIAPTFTPTLVEAPFLIRVDGTLVSGVLDAADTDVHDTKTTSTPSKVDPARHEVEAALYWWGYEALTGKPPGRFVLDVIARNGRTKIVEVEPDFTGAAEVVGLVAHGILSGDFSPTGVRTGSCGSCPYLGGPCIYGRV